ncbi:ferritin-like domain-containing protein [Kitasatospora sp. GP82]|uniref:ferritin-like domain-containing protein n=1 Tax=Kitasatospora sp. GP82 TaxID=3035089 RepID=UPI002475939E|nr:ferritin-like domain-containing protein [Kitasatospora sp. GP82]MDH6125007.1 bacterioferritin [Kitasatospora sp. GP82]
MTDSLVLDVERIRKEARQTMAAGPVTGAYGLDTERVVSVLNDVVTTEVVGWLRYTRHAIKARGDAGTQVSELFTAHADKAMEHATAVAERIAQLGGRPNFAPSTLAQRAHTTYAAPEGAALTALLEQNLVAARTVIATYLEIARWLGDRDPTTRTLIESLARDEQQNVDALTALLRNS